MAPIVFRCRMCNTRFDSKTHVLATAEKRILKAGWTKKIEGEKQCVNYYCPDCSKLTVLKTPRGTLYIGATFKDEKEAHDNGYGYWFTHRVSDGTRIDIYSKSLSDQGLAMVVFDK